MLILLHNRKLEASILREVLADDGGCVGYIRPVREMIVVKKLIFYLNKCV